MSAGNAAPSSLPRRVAVGVTPMETRHDVVLQLAERAEALGYDAFLLAEGWGHDATALLGAVAVRTRRIRIGTGVLNPWGRSPATLAMLAGTLDALSDGRFVLGLGAGSPGLAEAWHDDPFCAPTARLGTVAREVRSLLTGGRAATPRTRVPGLYPAVVPARHVPLHLAALGPASVRLAGEVADAWYPFLLPRSALADGAKVLQDSAMAADRSTPLLSPGIPVSIAADPGQARELAAWWITTYLLRMGPIYGRMLRRQGYGAAVDAVLEANPAGSRRRVVPAAAEVLVDQLTLCGDPATGRAALDSWWAAGAELPVAVLPPGRPLEELELALQALAPRVLAS